MSEVTKKSATLDDYQVARKIYESSNSLVYRAHSKLDNCPVIIKVLKQDYPTPSELTRYKQEYEITRSLKIEGVISAYALVPYESTLAIILEDFGAESLETLLTTWKPSILEFLHFAIQVSGTLTEIHDANIIHKDINPSNIVLDRRTNKVKVIDFGISSIFVKENPIMASPSVLEGTLAYMSPEQTGRMNRSLDYRTDFYSLGATFYRVLTDRLLFDAQDALELVHCHLARQPIPPHAIDPSIPQMISDIIMKLTAKAAEDRYQSATGLKTDLEACLAQFINSGHVEVFPLARHDAIEQLQIPQKLYGREPEIDQLLNTFKNVAQIDSPDIPLLRHSVEVMLVGGYSGIGKTSLIKELYKPLSQQKGYFISGKFDQFQRNIPYSAIAAAFQSLIRQLLTEDETQLEQWKREIQNAVRLNGQVLIDFIPEVEQIIGPQDPVNSLEPAQAETRFKQVFQSFMSVFCRRAHPLVLFLDDLQWADFGTLKLIELMVTDVQVEALFLIGAYRDNEVDDTHPTMLMIERLRKQGMDIRQIILEPLKLSDIEQLLAETLNRPQPEVCLLVELIAQKTLGNPFFINEILETICQANLFKFNRGHRCWEWNIENIQKLEITDNVVDLMINKLCLLSEETQNILRLSACIGNRFDLNTLSIINEKPLLDTFRDLLPAIQVGLIQPTSELRITSKDPISSALVVENYQHRHDRIQQAAYALIDSESRKDVHLRIGRLLLKNLGRDELQEKIFTLVDHLNKGLELIEDEAEKIEVLRLNLSAGKKAKEAIAYKASREYLLVAEREFPGDIWHRSYEMALELYRELAEIQYLNGDIQESQRLLDLSIDRAKSPLDAVGYYILWIGQTTLQGKQRRALNIARAALRMFGEDLPGDDTEDSSEISEQESRIFRSEFNKELNKFRVNIEDHPIPELYNHFEMKLPEKQAILRILARLSSAAFIFDGNLYGIVTAKMVNVCIEYGHTSTSPIAYCFFAITNSFLKNYRLGYEIGLLSMKLADNSRDLVVKGFVHFAFPNFSMVWLEHVKYAEKITEGGVEASIQAGDLQYAGYAIMWGMLTLIYQGRNLHELSKVIERGLQLSKQSQDEYIYCSFLVAKMLIRNLVGEGREVLCFDLEEISESEFLERYLQNPQLRGVLAKYQILKIQALYLHGQSAQLAFLDEASRSSKSIYSHVLIADLNYYSSLTLIRCYESASTENRQQYWKKIEINQEEMKEWSDNCPDNFLHKYLLVAAEMSRVSGKWQEAMDFYDLSIESAKEYEFVQDEALGNELAAKFWLELGKESFAKLYMRRAHQCYQIWGATRKVEYLEEDYPQWFTSQPQMHRVTTTSPTTGSGHTGKFLDIETVIKASETLSKEIILGNLLGSLMKIAIENAGAQKGFLIFGKEGGWFIEAEGNVDETGSKVLQSIPIDHGMESEGLHLSSAIVNYVSRVKQSVILDDACNQGDYTQDPYIQINQSKSILCIPLIYQTQVNGILYLENNLTTNAFTSDRVELLNVISSQAAIALENSRLYQTLEQKVEERTRELSQTLEILKETQAKLVFENDLLRSAEQSSSYYYQVGGSLPLDSPTYVVRAADRYLYKALTRGELCYVMNARQMGKSSLMVRMMHQLKQEGHCCAVIDMTSIGTDAVTPAQWYKGLATILSQALDLTDRISLSSWWKERDDLPAAQRLGQFFDEILGLLSEELEHSDRHVYIFLDEIDCLLSLNFPVSDLLSLIRSLYNRKAINPLYGRLAFAFFGVATPSDLISDRNRTPFNLGQAIELSGFQAHEAQPLLRGLSEKVENPQTLLNEVLSWTGGQPFLTQKLCQMIRDNTATIPANTEAQWVGNLVQERIIESWETQDEPQHLRTIRDRLLGSECSSQLLSLYQTILDQGETIATNSPQERELLLAGVIVKQSKKLKIYNRIYERVFDSAWVSACQS